ncbi:class I SAM-dependent methyltransferase [Streptomyces venezuelae]|uniref:class I SAM-dependent methyltransferase n=1 Tax=Streptomyces venezuelae TaxID=54571 RepID=UPI003454CB43
MVMTPEGAYIGRSFDSLGLKYEQAFADQRQNQIDAVDELSNRLARGSRVLDVGCASGRPTSEQLCANGMDVIGIDVSQVMLAHARRQVPAGRFVLADLFGDTTGLGVYDAAACLYCLVNLSEARFVDGLRRLAGRVRPGGILLVAVPEFQGTEEEVRFVDWTYQPQRCLSEDVRRYAELAGLAIERVDVHTEPPSPGRPNPGNSLYLWASAHPT